VCIRLVIIQFQSKMHGSYNIKFGNAPYNNLFIKKQRSCVFANLKCPKSHYHSESDLLVCSFVTCDRKGLSNTIVKYWRSHGTFRIVKYVYLLWCLLQTWQCYRLQFNVVKKNRLVEDRNISALRRSVLVRANKPQQAVMFPYRFHDAG
jgi:hypothetical protein